MKERGRVVGEEVINRKVMDVEWGSVAICGESCESRGFSTLVFTLREKRKKPVHGLSRRGL